MRRWVYTEVYARLLPEYVNVSYDLSNTHSPPLNGFRLTVTFTERASGWNSISNRSRSTLCTYSAEGRLDVLKTSLQFWQRLAIPVESSKEYFLTMSSALTQSKRAAERKGYRQTSRDIPFGIFHPVVKDSEGCSNAACSARHGPDPVSRTARHVATLPMPSHLLYNDTNTSCRLNFGILYSGTSRRPSNQVSAVNNSRHQRVAPIS